MLSLSPRMDLFRFKFPKDFLPEELNEKYKRIISKNKAVIYEPIEYLNESIQGITFPGISDLLVEQTQHSPLHPENENYNKGIKSHRLNVEPQRTNVTYSPANPLSQITGEFTVTLRRCQGLYNYWMLYESIFYKTLKQYNRAGKDDVFYISIMNEDGIAVARLKLFQPRIDGIDGLEFSYNKTERENGTFDIKFRFNNIDFDIVEETEEK